MEINYKILFYYVFFRKESKKTSFLEKVNTRQTKTYFLVVFFILLSLDKKSVFTLF